MATWLYQFVLCLALPVVRLRLLWRARSEPAYGLRRAERFGRVPEEVPTGCVWFHTVSAGETIAAAPLIRQLTASFKDTPFLVTTMTPTGSEQVSALLSDCAAHCYAPYDFDFAVRRFFERVRPKILVLMETELWPNLIAAAHGRNIPVVLVNARMSARSARGYQRISSLTRRMLGQLSDIACQSETHVERFVNLGADPVTTTAMGSVKYDVTLPDHFAEDVARLRRVFALGGRPVWIAASTHPGEEEIVLRAFGRVRGTLPDVCLLLVPRHPVRADDVCALIVSSGYSVTRQSGCNDRSSAEPSDVVVGDVMGTLLILYGLADVAFIGGSLVELGGHNPLEPAACGVPMAAGPHQFNFTDVMADLQGRGGLRTVKDAEELAQAILDWLVNPTLRARDGAGAATAIVENRGATERVAELLGARISTALSE